MNELKLVIWEDAFGCPSGWQMEEDLQTTTSVVHSVGFVVAETAEQITLAPHVGGQN